MPWMTKDADKYTAHFILDDGTPACSREILSDGKPRLAPFKTRFVPLRDHSHLCTTCRRLHGGTCRCGRCGVQASAAYVPPGRRPAFGPGGYR